MNSTIRRLELRPLFSIWPGYYLRLFEPYMLAKSQCQNETFLIKHVFKTLRRCSNSFFDATYQLRYSVFTFSFWVEKFSLTMLLGDCWSVLHYSTLQLHCWTAPLGPLLTLLFPLLGKADITHPKQSNKTRDYSNYFYFKHRLCI